jgi:hypothetical protein
MHINPRHSRRADTDVFGAPSSVAGLADTTVVASGEATATGLAVDKGAATASARVSMATTAGITDLTAATTSVSPTPTATAAQSSSSHGGQLGKILGISIGAFAGVACILLLVLFYLRRQSQKLKEVRSARSRNIQGDKSRRRSRLEPWAKLGEGEDKGNGGEWSAAGEMEKMDSMFKASSIHSGATSTRTDFQPDPTQLSRYHQGLAEELAGAPTAETQRTSDYEHPQPVRPYTGRAGEPLPISWGAETTGDESFLSLRSTGQLSGSMSPTATGLAKPTPPVSDSPLSTQHERMWQSAVVVHPPSMALDGEEDPFANPRDPFADAQDARARAFAASVVDADAGGHRPTASSASSEHAMQSLIAALDLPPKQIEQRLRVASLSPSEYSAASAYSDEQEVIRDFPLPPLVAGGDAAQTLTRG